MVVKVTKTRRRARIHFDCGEQMRRRGEKKRIQKAIDVSPIQKQVEISIRQMEERFEKYLPLAQRPLRMLT